MSSPRFITHPHRQQGRELRRRSHSRVDSLSSRDSRLRRPTTRSAAESLVWGKESPALPLTNSEQYRASVETLDHRALKSIAVGWLFSQRCRAVAMEVTGNIPRWRFDAAGWRHTRLESESIVIECKQSRADFLRDDAAVDELVAERDRLRDRRTRIEETRVKVDEPHLGRTQQGLFEDRTAWDFSQSKLADYRRVLVGLKRIDRSLHGETKFCLAVRYRLADLCYLLCPSGMIRPREVPEGWGLLECPRFAARRASRTSAFASVPIRETVAASPLASKAARRERLLRNIAVSASRAAFGHLALTEVPRNEHASLDRLGNRKRGSLFEEPPAHF